MGRRTRQLLRSEESPEQKIRVLFVTAELAPFSQSGGLGDVAASLPKALRSFPLEQLIVTPCYGSIEPSRFSMARRLISIEKTIGTQTYTATVWEGRTLAGIRVFLLDCPALYGSKIQYGTENDAARFGFLSYAALELVKKLSWVPDIVHLHDWHTALAAYLMKRDPFFAESCSVLHLHNVGYQGNFDKSWVASLGLSWSDFHIDGFEFYEQLSFLKAGVVSADRLVAVSPRYAEEIKTESAGFRLEGLFQNRSSALLGIQNGIDYELWDPSYDRVLAQSFSAEDMNGRRRCKADLQRLYRLPVRESKPVVAVVSRIASQKGLSLVLEAGEQILAKGFQLILQLSGDEDGLAARIAAFAEQHPDTVGFRLQWHEPAVHSIVGGADFVLIPSLYEPCGLVALEALRYGAIPVAHAAGGLLDVIEDASASAGNGFLFSPHTTSAMLDALDRALVAWKDSRSFRQLQLRAMSTDVSWRRSASAFYELYQSL